MEELAFVVMGHCRECGQDLRLNDYSLPEHENTEGERCKNSKYSPSRRFYLLESLADAKRMADVISADTRVCLHLSLKDRHGIHCGDGRECAEERNRRAKSLAQFVNSWSAE